MGGATDSRLIASSSTAGRESEVSRCYIKRNGRAILGVRPQHFDLYTLLCRSPNVPCELARVITLALFLYELKTVVDDALAHQWLIVESSREGCCSYLDAPIGFACRRWTYCGSVDFDHPRHGWLRLTNIVLDEQLRRYGDRDLRLSQQSILKLGEADSRVLLKKIQCTRGDENKGYFYLRMIKTHTDSFYLLSVVSASSSSSTFSRSVVIISVWPFARS